MEQGYGGDDVLARPSEVRKGFIVGDDPSVHVAGYGACVAFDLPIHQRVFPNKLLSGLIDLPFLGF